MRVAIVTVHHAVGHGRFMREALRRIGVDVRSLGPSPGNVLWGATIPQQYVWQPDGPAMGAWTDWKPDLVILMHDAQYRHVVYHDVPHVVYTVDNHVRNFRQPMMDHYFLAHRHGQAMPVEGNDVTWLPCAYDPTIYTPSPIAWKNRQFDVALVGVLYESRVQLLNRLAGGGFKIAAGTGAILDRFREVYQNSRISLCLSHSGDVAMRVFETAAMRCLVLSDPCADYSDLQPQGIVIFRSADECVQSVRWLLEHPTEAEALIEQSARWVGPHTWDARAKAICEWYRATYGAPPSER